METMYDRLGDLLSEVLESGHVKFMKTKPSNGDEKPDFLEESADEGSSKAEELKEILKNGNEKSSGDEKSSANSNAKKDRSGLEEITRKTQEKAGFTIIKAMSPGLERAYRILGTVPGASRGEIKKAYKEKLQYFHPDKHSKNAILIKVATDKTRQVMEAYELIKKCLEE